MTQKKETKEKIVLPVLDVSGKEVEKIELDRRIFDGSISKGSVYRAIHNYLANNRSRAASTKTRADVSGGGIKPWRQKGTGRARVGSTRNPLWRHGGVVFGPHPRDFSYVLPKKIKKLALKSIFNDKALNNELIIINALILDNPKTKTFVDIIKKLKIKEKALLITDTFSENIMLSTRNIPDFQIADSKSVNVYDVLSFKKLIITKEALRTIIERLK
jgi:large subunit ribosomal protein L4